MLPIKKRCTHCGGPGKMTRYGSGAVGQSYRVACDSCGAQTPWRMTMTVARMDWDGGQTSGGNPRAKKDQNV